MYRRITIRNFRSIEDATVTLSPFTVVVGQNGSGKSNFVDAFVFMRDIAFDAETAVSSRGGISGVTRWSKTKPYDAQISLRVAKSRDRLETDYFEHQATLGSGAEGAWRFKKEAITIVEDGHASHDIRRQKGNALSLVLFGRKEERSWDVRETTSAMVVARQVVTAPIGITRGLLGIRRYKLSPDEMRQPQLVTESGQLSENGTNIATALRKMRENKRIDEILAPMQRIVPGLVDITTVPAGRHMLLEFHQRQSGGTATFTASEISEGALRALGVIVAARQMGRDELLIIEEPEANIHAGAAGLVFDVLREASRQGSVLITTHSPEILDAAQDEDIVVCAYTDGVTRLGPLDARQRDLVRQGLFKLAELMRTEPLRIEGDTPESAA